MRIHNFSGLPGSRRYAVVRKGWRMGLLFSVCSSLKKPRQYKKHKPVCHSFNEKWTKVRLRQLRYMYRPDCARMCVCVCVRSSAAWLCKNDTDLQKITLILIYNTIKFDRSNTCRIPITRSVR